MYYNSKNSIYLKFYDHKSKKIKYGVVSHEIFQPYLLVEKNDVSRRVLLNLINDDKTLIENFKIIRLQDRILRKDVEFFKVFVKTPLDVKKVREEFASYGIRVEEANIKFHRNVLVDLSIIPFVKDYKNDDKEDPFGFNKIEEDVVIPDYIAFDIEVVPPKDGFPNPYEAKQPVILISISTKEGEMLLVNCKDLKLKGLPKFVDGAKTICYRDEIQMLRDFLELLKQYPLWITFNGDGFDLPYIHNRYLLLLGLNKKKDSYKEDAFKSPRANKTKIYIVQPYTHPHTEEEFYWWEGYNSMHFDLYAFLSNSSIKNYTLEQKYNYPNLDDIAQGLLGKGKTEKRGSVLSLIENNEIDRLLKYSVMDARLTREIFEYNNYIIFRTAVILSRIVKLPPGELIRTRIQTWITQMMLWAHRKTNSVFPSKEYIMSFKEKTSVKSKSKTNKKYAGAEVFDIEKKGLYPDVYVIDFASLYPTIIINKNISYETVNPLFECNEYEVAPEVEHKICKDVKGIFSEVVQVLRDLRVHKYKKLAKDKSLPEERRAFYDAIQMTLKVLINASYGVFASNSFQLYTPVAAETVTSYARHTIRRAREIAEQLGFKVIYGDSVSKDTFVVVSQDGNAWEVLPIEEVYEKYGENYSKRFDGKEEAYPKFLYTLTIEDGKVVPVRVRRIIRHKTEKEMYKVCVNDGWCVEVTEDHSIMDPSGRPTRAKDIASVVVAKRLGEFDKGKNVPDEVALFTGLSVAKGNYARIPSEVWSWNERGRLLFLLGMLNENGTIIKTRSDLAIKIEIISRALAYQLKGLASLIGIKSTLSVEKNNVYVVLDASDLAYVIKRHKVEEFLLNKEIVQLDNKEGDIEVRKVSVYSLGKKNEYVYDLEVEGNHTFLANFIWVHNTDSLFLLSKNVNNPKEALEQLIEKINKETGFEIELDKVFRWVGFHGKKNYIGMTDDGKLVIKGLMIKKSNTPELFSEAFQRIHNILLECKTIEDLKKRRDEIKRILTEIRDTIEKGNVNDLEKIAFVSNLNKRLEEYKRTSPHIKALLNAEKLFGVKVPKSKGTRVQYVITHSGEIALVEGIKLSKKHINWRKYLEYYNTVFGQIATALDIPLNILSKNTSLLNFLKKDE